MTAISSKKFVKCTTTALSNLCCLDSVNFYDITTDQMAVKSSIWQKETMGLTTYHLSSVEDSI